MYVKQSDATDVLRKRIHDGDGTIKVRRFFLEENDLPMQMAVWELEPGVSEGGHVHQDDDALVEFYYFLKGSGVMSVDGDDVPVQAGEAVMVPPGAERGLRNTGDQPLKLVIVWAKPNEATFAG